jgi:hypothetical protein
MAGFEATFTPARLLQTLYSVKICTLASLLLPIAVLSPPSIFCTRNQGKSAAIAEAIALKVVQFSGQRL